MPVPYNPNIAKRFRGYLPVVVDVETGGLNYQTDALLEVAAIIVKMDSNQQLFHDETLSYHVLPFEGAKLDEEALKLNKIDPYHPFRFAVTEKIALTKLFEHLDEAVKESQCQRAVLVGHNAWFDLFFLKAAMKRCHLLKKTPFHSFTTLDTATLSALIYGETVLSRSAKKAGIDFNRDEAHSAVYDAERTADLFCTIVNRVHELERRTARRE